MPIYEYECGKCSLRFELKRRFNEDGSGFCPQCGNEARRIFLPPPIIFKGSGFYVTDHRNEQKHHSAEKKRPGDDGNRSDSERESETKN